jgi:hypothetical protein
MNLRGSADRPPISLGECAIALVAFEVSGRKCGLETRFDSVSPNADTYDGRAGSMNTLTIPITLDITSEAARATRSCFTSR